MTLGEKIRDLRIKNNMTMDDLARLLGVQRSAVNKYEKGIVTNLRRSTIADLARIFQVSPCYFLEDDSSLTETTSHEESRLLTAYRAASREARGYAMDILEKSAAERKEKGDEPSSARMA